MERENNQSSDSSTAVSVGAESQWRVITPLNLPQLGDEVGGWFGVFNPEFEVRPFRWPMPSSSKLKPEIIYEGCKVAGWSHFRPLNAPERKR